MLLGSSDQEIALAAIICGMIFMCIWTIAHQWRRARVAAYNAKLKQLMIERGMNASEIARVLESKGED